MTLLERFEQKMSSEIFNTICYYYFIRHHHFGQTSKNTIKNKMAGAIKVNLITSTKGKQPEIPDSFRAHALIKNHNTIKVGLIDKILASVGILY